MLYSHTAQALSDCYDAETGKLTLKVLPGTLLISKTTIVRSDRISLEGEGLLSKIIVDYDNVRAIYIVWDLDQDLRAYTAVLDYAELR